MWYPVNCLNCKCKLVWGCDFDAADYGYDTDGIVSTYSCSNDDCGLFYEFVELFPPENESYDYYEYGESFVRFYKIDE